MGVEDHRMVGCAGRVIGVRFLAAGRAAVSAEGMVEELECVKHRC